MARNSTAAAEAQVLLDRFASAAELRASCERFGLLGHQVVAFAERARADTQAQAERFLEEQFDRMLLVICPHEHGEDRNWRKDSARELAQSAAREDLEGALRDLSRLRVSVEALAFLSASARR